MTEHKRFVSRAGEKLDHAIKNFDIEISGLICADLGSNTGGFVDCLLAHGAKKVYAVETGYGVLDWGLRNDPRVVVMERTNAMHVKIPESVDIVTIDVSWTKQEKILPNAINMLRSDGHIISLIKLHYESPNEWLSAGKLQEDRIQNVIDIVSNKIIKLGLTIRGYVRSPILGKKAGNTEYLFHITRK